MIYNNPSRYKPNLDIRQPEYDQRSASLNSRAQMILNKQRMQ